MSLCEHRLTFEAWIKEQAALIDSDGCSWATGARRICCFIHDCEYFYMADSKNAYLRYWRHGDSELAWRDARRTTRAEADGDFLKCLRSKAWFGYYSPLAIARYTAVRQFGQKAWDEHRAREAQAAPT